MIGVITILFPETEKDISSPISSPICFLKSFGITTLPILSMVRTVLSDDIYTHPFGRITVNIISYTCFKVN